MKDKGLSLKIVYLMLIIYLISALQFIVNETRSLTSLGPRPYNEKLNYLDKQYYRNAFYKYYAWADQLLPKDVSFSIYYNKGSKVPYLKWEHKLNYYFYPRFVSFTGNASENTVYYQFKTDDIVMLLSPRDADIRHAGEIMYLSLSGRKYYCVAKLDDKYLFIEKAFIKNTVLKRPEWINIRVAFKKLYGFNIDKAGL